MAEIKVQGLSELEAALHKLDQQIAKKAVRNAVGAGGRVIRDLMRQKAPRDKGNLAKGIVVSTSANLATGTFIAKVRPSRKRRADNKPSPAYEALWNEYGVRPHIITAKGLTAREVRQLNKGALRLLSGQLVAAVRHPGIAPHPFMRPAADEGWPKALNAFRDELRRAINEQVLRGQHFAGGSTAEDFYGS